MSKTTAIIENGYNVYATGGAVYQDGKLKIMQCNTCGEQVVWAKSAKTGRFYLVNVSRGASGARFYAKRNAHSCADHFRQAIKTAEAFGDQHSVDVWTKRLEEVTR